MMHRSLLLPIVLAALLPAAVAAQDDKLAASARAVLEKHCYRCHGQNASNEGGLSYILDVPRLIAKRKLAPRDLDKSKLYQRAAVDKDMPPDDVKERPSAADLDVLKRWIEAGAPAVETIAKARPFKGLNHVLDSIHAHLARSENSKKRPFLRYFTLTHLHDNPKVLDGDLALYRAAVSKLINSLHWKNAIVVPEPIDAEQTIFALDLRDFDWDRHHLWQQVLEAYPYGLQHEQYPDDRERNARAKEIYEWTGTKLPYVRADWFIATAGRPPLYHTLLYDEVLPELKKRPRDPKKPDNPRNMTARDLEKHLDVDIGRNFERGQLARAAFKSSGVSGQNRLLERHRAAYGSYWKSYDFKKDSDRNNLTVLPLGPLNLFEKHPFAKQAFVHDGGEIIFHLPNGLQGYLLIKGDDERINDGPIEVVSDSLKTSGTNVITNGLSCMACHKNGMIREFKDTVGDAKGVAGPARDKVRELYVSAEEMGRLLDSDDERFLPALERASGRFLRTADDRRDIRDFAEPIGPIARWYTNQELTANDAAAELGLPSGKELQKRITPYLRKSGLGELEKDGGTIKRAEWEKRSGTSLFQETAGELELGAPARR